MKFRRLHSFFPFFFFFFFFLPFRSLCFVSSFATHANTHASFSFPLFVLVPPRTCTLNSSFSLPSVTPLLNPFYPSPHFSFIVHMARSVSQPDSYGDSRNPVLRERQRNLASMDNYGWMVFMSYRHIVSFFSLLVRPDLLFLCFLRFIFFFFRIASGVFFIFALN